MTEEKKTPETELLSSDDEVAEVEEAPEIIELDEDENFVVDLIGLTAVDTKGNEIGELVDVLTPNKICDVYVFDTDRGEMMIPALRRVVKEVDLDEEKIILDENVLPEVVGR